jgi:hypothetical protein
MRTYRLLIASIVVSFYMTSCHKDDKIITSTNEYLPLEVGNYWILDYSGKKEIIGTKTINNKTYFILLYQGDSSYFRIENDKVYAIENSEMKESVKFDLSAHVNETWNYDSWTVKLLSRSDTITINNKKIANCYRFYFDVPLLSDEEHSISLAPGIGFIQEQCGFCIHQVRKLNKARIRGREIEYK